MNDFEDFPAILDLPVLWGDQDLYGHVNNIIYVKWFESSRVQYWDASGIGALIGPLNWGPILANVSCNFRQQIKHPDHVRVAVRISRLGRTSITMEHAVWSTQSQSIAATGASVVVLFDYGEQRPQPITTELRECIQAFEGHTFAS